MLIACLLALAGGAACAGGRVALVVGNSDYDFGRDEFGRVVGRLDNPKNDADDIAATLRRLQFDVDELKDVTEAKFDTALDAFEGKARDADVAFFFFSGHGVRIDKSGYLVPIGFEPASEGSALRRLIGIQETVERIEKAARVSVFVLDACRDSPLPEQLRRGGRSKGIGAAEKGLPLLSALGSNTFIVYATVPGETASDGGGRNSPFTTALLKHLETPGLEIQAIFTRVTADVLAGTGRKQQPERLSRLQNDLILLPGATGAPGAPLSADAQAWTVVQGSQSEAVLDEFARSFPNSVYAGFAKARAEELRRGKSPSSWTWPWNPGQQAGPAKAPETLPAAPVQPKTAETQVAVVVPKTPPVPLKTAEETCEDGLLVSVAVGKKPCIKPGSGAFFKDCPDCPEMVIVPEGRFTMGSPDNEPGHQRNETKHEVRFAKPFAVGRFAITFAEWDACEADGGCGSDRAGDDWGRGDQPAVRVNWNQAKLYVRWLSKKTRKQYRLLSEAEREYVTRAGTATPFWWGSSPSTEQANYGGNDIYKGTAQGDYLQQTLPVKSFKPNPWGLYQVHGNVFDWVEDCSHADYRNAPADGSAWTTGECAERIIRGGSWNSKSSFLRAARRISNHPGGRFGDVGFRVGLTLE